MARTINPQHVRLQYAAGSGGSNDPGCYGEPALQFAFPTRDIVQPRHSGHALARSHAHSQHIVYPERYHERYRLPPGIEYQPF